MIGGASGQSSGAMLSFFSAYMEHQAGFRMLALFPDQSEDATIMLKEVRSLYLPGSMIIPIFDPESLSPVIPEVKGYPEKPALYICGNGQCYPPVSSKKEFDLWINQVLPGFTIMDREKSKKSS